MALPAFFHEWSVEIAMPNRLKIIDAGATASTFSSASRTPTTAPRCRRTDSENLASAFIGKLQNPQFTAVRQYSIASFSGNPNKAKGPTRRSVFR